MTALEQDDASIEHFERTGKILMRIDQCANHPGGGKRCPNDALEGSSFCSEGCREDSASASAKRRLGGSRIGHEGEEHADEQGFGATRHPDRFS